MRYFSALHPAVSLVYFAAMLVLTLTVPHPLASGISLLAALVFCLLLRGGKAARTSAAFTLPLALIVALANPLFNHRGVTTLFFLFDNPVTLEAVAYGLVSACQLAAVILWFSCYQVVMTSDKFLFLFGKAVPAASLLITMTLRFVPQLHDRFESVRKAQRSFYGGGGRLTARLRNALTNLSALLTWSLEAAVQTADSMNARGYGIKRRNTYHLFRFDSRDARTLAVLLCLLAPCVLARAYGLCRMEFYPRITGFAIQSAEALPYGAFAALAWFPLLAEGGELFRWRCFGLTR